MTTGLVALCSLACNELEETITAPRPQASVNLLQAARSARQFKELSVDSLWLMIAAGDSSAVVGVKPPGASRGVIKGRVGADRNLLNRAERDLERLGLSIVARSATLPAMRVRIDGVSQLGRLLAEPWLDYVEPAVIRGSIMPQIGCENPAYDGNQHMTWGDVTDMVPYTYASMDIPDAWALSSGDGVTIGLTDTGIFASNSQLTTNMTAGYSSIRTYEYLHTSNYGSAYISDSDCSHGSRMAGSIGAPRDGTGPIGVAWGANLVSVRHNDDVATFDTWYAVQAIDMAAARSNIVVMAWGAPDWWYNSIEDAITYWHYNWDRLFIGAAGTYMGWEPYEFRNNTFFPAEVEEVVAVTAVDDPFGNLSSNAAHGPGVDIAAFAGQVSTGKGSDLTTLMGTSNASGVTAGVAAMIWSRYPSMTRDQVRHRLSLTA
ncbi:MAG: S8/S53 family peptidase, partial [Gemmatimonadota bacterium]